ncbi:MAG: pimeloyl-ACP methyl ester carboxylesterase [Hyphomicrobiaceae bacterium]
MDPCWFAGGLSLTLSAIVATDKQVLSGGGGRWRSAPWLLLILLLLPCSCSWFRGAAIPVWHDSYPATVAPAKGLVVLFPGIGDRPGDFLRHGFVEQIQSVNPSLDVVAVDAQLAYYVRGLLSERVHQDIVKPRLASYEHIWLVGISLGGLGAMSYAADYPHVVDGVVLLAPFLGAEDVLEQVRAAGGVRSWTAPTVGRFEDPMRQLSYAAWTWARLVADRADQTPVVYLGYGAADRFAKAHALLAEALPVSHIRLGSGGHDWTMWTTLFEQLASVALRDVGSKPRARRRD